MHAKTLGITLLLTANVLILALPSWGQDKVYTNADLKKYQDKEESVTAAKPEDADPQGELTRGKVKLQLICTPRVKAQLRARGGDCEEWREGEMPYEGRPTPPMPGLKESPKSEDTEEVAISISGCQTLQEALDGKPGNTTATITVLRHGRTIEEICDSVGRGCRSCAEMTQHKQGISPRH